MEDDPDDQDEALETTITVLSALPVIGGQVSAVAKLGLQAWGKRKRRRFDADFELLMRELAQRENRRPDDEAWFKERLREYRVAVATEKGFDRLLRCRDASARLSISRLYAAYVGGGDMSWARFLEYGDFLSKSNKEVISGTLILKEHVTAAIATHPLEYVTLVAFLDETGRTGIQATTNMNLRGEGSHTHISESVIMKAMLHLKRSHIGVDLPGGTWSVASGPGVIHFSSTELLKFQGLWPYLLLDESAAAEVLATLRQWPKGVTLETLCRSVDDAVAGGVDLGDLESALESLCASHQIVVEVDGNHARVRLANDPAT